MASLKTLASLEKDAKELIEDIKKNPEQYEDYPDDIPSIIHEAVETAVTYYEDQDSIVKDALEKNFSYDTDLVEDVADKSNIRKRLMMEAFCIAEQVYNDAFHEAGMF